MRKRQDTPVQSAQPSHFLHGTRLLHNEPAIDQGIWPIPPAYAGPIGKGALNLVVLNYNTISSGSKRFALGRLATRTLNSFMDLDSERQGGVTTTDLIDLWNDYGLDMDPQLVGPALRGINALDAIRHQIDSEPFVDSAKGHGRQQLFCIAPDIAFIDQRPTPGGPHD